MELKIKSVIHKCGYMFGWMGECCPPTFEKRHTNFPAVDVFLRSINTTNNTKDANYITAKVKQYITRVDPKNIVQVWSNNVEAMKNAACNISQEWLHIH